MSYNPHITSQVRDVCVHYGW